MPNEFETPGTALATLPAGPAPDGWMPMPLPVHAIIARAKALDEIIDKIFEEGVHYGVPFGDTKDPKAKRSLLKPGIDAICGAFCFLPDFIALDNVQTSDFINITLRCDLVHTPSGRIVGSGIGNCNSREEKYRWKPGSGKPVCPECGVDQVWKSRDPAQPGYFCWQKKGGCGAKYAEDDQRIVSQKTERVANDNAWDQLNTIWKMAQKRAAMSAVIPACGLSNRFSAGDEDRQAEQERRQEPPRGRPAPPPESRDWQPPPDDRGAPPPQEAPPETGAPDLGRPLTDLEAQDIISRAKTLSTRAGFEVLGKEMATADSPWNSRQARDVLTREFRAWERKAGAPAGRNANGTRAARY
jgi:hypothetical protein